MASHRQQQHHFLMVTIGIQGQINPARHLARQLVRHTDSRVTVATPLSSHRRMFPSHTSPDDVVDQGRISFAAYSDGYDGGFHPDTSDEALFMSQLKAVGSETLTRLARALAGRGRPVTCVVYTILLAWAADVATDLGVPSVLYWIQPASLFAIYYHYFHGLCDVIAAHKDDSSFELALPGLPLLRIGDLPSILVAGPKPYVDAHGDIFRVLDREKGPKVLVYTFRALETDAITAMHEHAELDLIPIGPMTDDQKDEKAASGAADLFEQDGSDYMRWLDSKEEGSVVYVSFGSISRLSKEQMEELSVGLEKSGREYLWVVRRDSREGIELEGGEKGMIVEWCDQVRVLSHRSVGCFVTHGGWNSTFESLTCGVPMVVVPQWLDQMTNARLVEETWGVGVRGERNGEGVVGGGEVVRCLDLVMGDCRGVEMRKRAEMWRKNAREAADHDAGASVRSLVDFVHQL